MVTSLYAGIKSDTNDQIQIVYPHTDLRTDLACTLKSGGHAVTSVHPGAQNGSLLKAGKMFSMSALHATPVAPAMAGELVAAAAPAAEEKASILRKALKVG